MRTVLRLVLASMVCHAMAPLAIGQELRAEGPPEVAPAEMRRQAVWNSPPMREGRAWVMAYARASKKFSQEQAEAYLARVAELDAEGMLEWLARVNERRRATFAAQADFERARGAALDQQRIRAAVRAAQAETRRPPPGTLTVVDPLTPRELAAQKALSRDATFRSRESDLTRTLILLDFLDRQQLRDDLRDLRAEKR